jgi:DNA-binding NtrC family response regulator
LTPLSASSTKEELDTRKKLTNILFVDDDTKFKIIKILSVAGWINSNIVKDIENPDSEIVNTAHILFIDINGVGLKMQFKDEGLGLANYLKKKYPEKKVIIYSTEPNGDRFHEAFRNVDDFLYKNADPTEFQEIIEQFSAEIKLI